MNDSKIPVRYARALFDISLEKGVIDKVYEDMHLVLTISSMKEVRQVLENPVILPSKRKEVMTALLPPDIQHLTKKFVGLIFDQGRETSLNAVARDFIDLTRKHRGIKRVILTTAVPAGENIKKELTDLLVKDKNEKIEFVEQVDNSIMGGFILRIDDSYIDASVKNRLNRFRKEFSLAGNATE